LSHLLNHNDDDDDSTTAAQNSVKVENGRRE
jgi:hypothetical protein